MKQNARNSLKRQNLLGVITTDILSPIMICKCVKAIPRATASSCEERMWRADLVVAAICRD